MFEMYQKLPKSYKGAFPFKIGTTSFIYPDRYVPNVETLGPYLDAIELLLFESQPENCLPDKEEISKLRLLAEKFQIAYNIHLPIDLYLGDENTALRNQAVDSLKHITELVSPLSPSTCTLHLIYNSDTCDLEKLKRWRQNTYQSLSRLIDSGVNATDISIENLNYPFDWIETIVSEFNFKVCLDYGHIFRYARDTDILRDRFEKRIEIIHLSGFEGDRDHISLDRLSQEQLRQIMNTLRVFQGTVSVEVFSLGDLTTSLDLLENSWQTAD